MSSEPLASSGHSTGHHKGGTRNLRRFNQAVCFVPLACVCVWDLHCIDMVYPMKRIYRDQGACTCHQASGDSWDCPEHYQDNRRFKEAKRIVQLAVEGRVSTVDNDILRMLRKIDAENAERSKEFFRKLNEDLDRREP